MPATIRMGEPHRSRFVELLQHGAAFADIHGTGERPAAKVPRPTDAFVDRELNRVLAHTRHICGFIDESRFRPNGRILDAGCGTAALSVALALHFPEATVDAFDADPHTVEAARVRVAAHDVTDSVRVTCVPAGSPLPFEPAAYGLVTCASVVEFITVESGRRRFLRALADATAPGGMLVLTTPNPLYVRELHTHRFFQNWRRDPDAPWASSRRWISRVLSDFEYLPETCKTPQQVRRRVGAFPGLKWLSRVDTLRPWQFLCFRKKDA